MITIAGSKKATGVRKLFKPSAKSFLAAVYREDNPGAKPRRSSRPDRPLSCKCRDAPHGSARRQHAGRRVASALP
jgi:hypothetical protein